MKHGGGDRVGRVGGGRGGCKGEHRGEYGGGHGLRRTQKRKGR